MRVAVLAVACLVAMDALGCEMIEHPDGYRYLECDPKKAADAKAEFAKARTARPPAAPPGHAQSVEEFKARMDAVNAKNEEERAAARTKADALRAEEQRREDLVKRGAAAKLATAPIVLKNIAPGLTSIEVRALHPEFRCDDDACSYFTEIPLGPPSEALATLGGVPVKSWFLPLASNKVTSVHVTLDADRFEQVRASMIERFGRPTGQEASTVTNRMGAKFDQQHLVWQKTDGLMRVMKRARRVDEMEVVVLSAQVVKEIDERAKSRLKKGAGDF
jgi:hypothetical protein